jgi:hypothetical protein
LLIFQAERIEYEIVHGLAFGGFERFTREEIWIESERKPEVNLQCAFYCNHCLILQIQLWAQYLRVSSFLSDETPQFAFAEKVANATLACHSIFNIAIQVISLTSDYFG